MAVSDAANTSIPENSLSGSGSSWIPGSGESTITFTVKSVNDTAEFYDLTFKVRNVDQVSMDLFDAVGNNFFSRTVSFHLIKSLQFYGADFLAVNNILQ